MPSSLPRSLVRSPAIMASLAAGLWLTLAGCGATLPSGGPAASVVPADVPWALHAPDLRALRERLAAFAGGFEGGAGALDLVAERFGLDLRSDEGLSGAGIDPAGSLALFGVEGGIGLSVSVRDPRAFEVATARQLGRLLAPASAAGPGATLAPSSSPATDASAPAAPRDFAAADGRGGATAGVAAGLRGSVGLVVVTDGSGAGPSPAAGLWQRLASLPEPQSLAASPRLAAAREAARESVAVELVLDAASVADGLGAPGLVLSTLSGLGPVRGGIALGAGRLALRLAADVDEGSSLPASWLAGAPGATPLAGWVPRNTSLFLRAALNLEKLRKLPSFLRERLLPQRLLGLEDAPIPDVPELVAVLGDEVAVAVLGLQPDATLGGVGGLLATPGRWPSVARVALIVRLRDRARLRAAMADIAGRMADPASAWTVSAIPRPGKHPARDFEGWTFARRVPEGGQPAETQAVILDGDVGLLVIGAAEVEGLLAVRTGAALSLLAGLEGEPGVGHEVLAARPDRRAEVGLQVGFLRFTRELMDRGAPPYFVKLLDSVHAIALGISVKAATPDGVVVGPGGTRSSSARLDLELRQ